MLSNLDSTLEWILRKSLNDEHKNILMNVEDNTP
jgi:hypothetical protein